jgi:hypothetical protein
MVIRLADYPPVSSWNVGDEGSASSVERFLFDISRTDGRRRLLIEL